MRKKGFTLVEMIAVVIIIAIVAILAVPSILKSIRDSKQEISEAMEKVIFSAADNYMDVDKYVYEKYNGNRYCITLRQLVESENLANPIYDPINSQEISQDKFVQVDIFNDTYSYKVVDSCQEIDLRTLAGRLKQQYKEGNTTGLLKDDTGYYYKGTRKEVSNNFVWFAGHLWRVISIDNDNNLTMITQQPLTTIQPASAVWTTEAEYEASYINHWLNDETDGVFYKSLNAEDKSKILDSTFNVGGLYNETTSQVENISSIITNKKVGLLDETQYTKAGDMLSFLNTGESWWLGNRYSISNIRVVFHHSGLYYNNWSWGYGVRPVIKISNITITTGTGTLTDPYRNHNTTNNTTNIKVGEYVSIPTSGTDCGDDKQCLFRVVSKDNNSIKVTLNGLLANKSQFGSTTTYTSENTIDTVVKAFAATIDSKYRYSGTDKTFGMGRYEDKANYTEVQNTTYTGDVGLPVIGEMFTANDIDLSTSTARTFVNADVIENPTVSSCYWTMSAGSAYVRQVDDDGNLGYELSSVESGVRPVLFLKNNLTFTGGEGTAENPFTLE